MSSASNEPNWKLDRARARAAFERAAETYDKAAVLQREVADRLLERLDLLTMKPARVLDVGSGTGYCTRALRRRYRGARVLALDIAFPMLQRARANTPWWRRLLGKDASRLCADAEVLPLATASVDMLVSNLTLQWCDPARAFAEFRRVLRPGGVLMFTTFGPDTLKELRAAWRAVDASLHVHPFFDMHDIGDALVHAGLAEPVMDVECVTLTYADPVEVMRDIKRIGAHNAAYGRARGLTGRQHFAGMRAAYRQWENADGCVPATYEVVFGHAWAPGGAGRLGVPPQDTAIKVPIVEVRRTPPHR